MRPITPPSVLTITHRKCTTGLRIAGRSSTAACAPLIYRVPFSPPGSGSVHGNIGRRGFVGNWTKEDAKSDGEGARKVSDEQVSKPDSRDEKPGGIDGGEGHTRMPESGTADSGHPSDGPLRSNTLESPSTRQDTSPDDISESSRSNLASPSQPPSSSPAASTTSAPSQLSGLLQSLQNNPQLVSLLTRIQTTAERVQSNTGDELAKLGQRISQATGYDMIDNLKHEVRDKESSLRKMRANLIELQGRHRISLTNRLSSQRELNDLLQRKSTWSEPDVARFTELVRSDHGIEREERDAKEKLEKGETEVEKAFEDLMQAILARYHEEQVWSDKIRSLSSYGSIAITAVNILIFILALLIIEPWKRTKLVEKFEARMVQREAELARGVREKLESLEEAIKEGLTRSGAMGAAAVEASSWATEPESESDEAMRLVEFDKEEESFGNGLSSEAVGDHCSPEAGPSDSFQEQAQEPTRKGLQWMEEERVKEWILSGVGGAIIGGLLVVGLSALRSFGQGR